MFILVIRTLTARYLHPRNGVLSWHITELDVWHVSDLPVVSRAGDKSPDDSNRDMSWRYEIFKWDANREGLCDAGCLMLMFSLEYKKSLCHFMWIKKREGVRIRDVNASFSGVSDKTMGKFYSSAAFVKVLFDKRASRRHYGLSAGANNKGWEMFLLTWVWRNNSVITSTPVYACVSWDLIWSLQLSMCYLGHTVVCILCVDTSQNYKPTVCFLGLFLRFRYLVIFFFLLMILNHFYFMCGWWHGS